ncbi:hypothetical protein JW964_04835, partial [candidate division KSB1 bacterium]|nr:hypothetical protein [candidate division KSB1 bacterium]
MTFPKSNSILFSWFIVFLILFNNVLTAKEQPFVRQLKNKNNPYPTQLIVELKSDTQMDLSQQFDGNDSSHLAPYFSSEEGLEGLNEMDFILDSQPYRSKNHSFRSPQFGLNTAVQSEISIIDDFQVSENAGYSYQTHPSSAMNKSGNFVLAWTDYRDGNYDIFCQRYQPNGEPIGQNFKVNDENVGIATRTGSQVAIDDEGNFICIWKSTRPNYYGINYYFLQRYDKNGHAIGKNIQISISEGASDLEIAMKGNGEYVLVWNWSYRAICAQRFSQDGNPIGTTIAVSDSTYSKEYPNVGIDENGNFTVVWIYGSTYRETNIYARRFDWNGNPIGAQFYVNDDIESVNWKQVPDIYVFNTGSLIVTWRDWRKSDRDPDIYAQRFDENGGMIGNNFKVNDDHYSCYQRDPMVAGNSSGNFALIWSDDRNCSNSNDLYCQFFDKHGKVVGKNFQVTNSYWGYTSDPLIKMDDSGNITTVWFDYRGYGDIYFQQYDINGAILAKDVKVNDDVDSGTIGIPIIGTASNGDFSIVWIDVRNEVEDVYCQFYHSDGRTKGKNLKVNDNTYVCRMYQPDLCVDPLGNTTIVWADWRNQIWCIYGQRYDKNGDLIGENFKINDGMEDCYREHPSVDCDENGNFTVVWLDERAGNNVDDIYGQRFDVNGKAIGNNFKINEKPTETFDANPIIEIDNAGNMVIIWNDESEDSNGDIYAQRCDAS